MSLPTRQSHRDIVLALPTEILLLIVERIPEGRYNLLTNLQLVSRRFYSLVQLFTRGLIHGLPPNLWEHAFSFLDIWDLTRLRFVCRCFNNLISNSNGNGIRKAAFRGILRPEDCPPPTAGMKGDDVTMNPLLYKIVFKNGWRTPWGKCWKECEGLKSMMASSPPAERIKLRFLPVPVYGGYQYCELEMQDLVLTTRPQLLERRVGRGLTVFDVLVGMDAMLHTELTLPQYAKFLTAMAGPCDYEAEIQQGGIEKLLQKDVWLGGLYKIGTKAPALEPDGTVALELVSRSWLIYGLDI
ncbi:hypothetical protein ABW19_dt0208921 [Dactylella cylindrospora]|nr:hypothetical protein ABW19_dt0208921 [Dactylella cylindrospora]